MLCLGLLNAGATGILYYTWLKSRSFRDEDGLKLIASRGSKTQTQTSDLLKKKASEVLTDISLAGMIFVSKKSCHFLGLER